MDSFVRTELTVSGSQMPASCPESLQATPWHRSSVRVDFGLQSAGRRESRHIPARYREVGPKRLSERGLLRAMAPWCRADAHGERSAGVVRSRDSRAQSVR